MLYFEFMLEVVSKLGDRNALKVTRQEVVCSMCEEGIVDSPSSKKCESIFGDGPCASWLHRCCAGLSQEAFAVASKSKNKFFCASCKLLSNERELESQV